MTKLKKIIEKQFDPKHFVVSDRFKFWSDTEQKPSESVQELATRIRQDAATHDISAITDLHDKAMRTRFINFINNEAMCKSLFKHDDNDKELIFAKEIQVVSKTDNTDKVARETVHENKHTPVYKVKR